MTANINDINGFDKLFDTAYPESGDTSFKMYIVNLYTAISL